MAVNPDETPTSSKILWSEEVARAEANHPLPPQDPTYEFSNGRRFVEKVKGPYG